MSRVSWQILLLVLSVTVGDVYPAQLLKMGKNQKFAVISHGEKGNWAEDDTVCLYRGPVEVACGRVVKSTSRAAVMKIITRRETPREGDEVRRSSQATWEKIQKEKEAALPDITDSDKRSAKAADEKGEEDARPEESRRKNRRFARVRRSRGSTENEVTTGRPARRTAPRRKKPKRDIALMGENTDTKAYLYDQLVKQRRFDTLYTADLTIGGTVGLNHFYPLLHVQFAITRNIALGLAPFYFAQEQDTASISGLGGHVTFNYYHDYTYRGLWLQAGAGIIKFNASVPGTDESQTRLSFLGTIGWRQRWDLGINVGAAAGIQFIANQNLQIVDLGYRNLQPTVIIDFGLNF